MAKNKSKIKIKPAFVKELTPQSDLETEKNSESDSSESFDEDHGKFASSTQIEPPTKSTSKSEIRLKLAEALCKTKAVNVKHKRALTKISWDDLAEDFGDVSKEELSEQLEEIVKSVGTIRTLREILQNYISDFEKLELKKVGDSKPKKPMSAFLFYLKENRTKLTKQAQEEAGSTLSYNQVVSFGIKKFKALPAKKQEPYKQMYEEALVEFNKQNEDFLDTHPELKKTKGKRQSRVKLLTPFNHYREELEKGTNPVSFPVAQKMWKQLSGHEKGRYISEVANMETDREKKLTKEDLKLMDQYMGIPKKPFPVYNTFVSRFKEGYAGDKKTFINECSIAWKKVSDAERKTLDAEYETALEKWRKKMLKYIRGLPKDQQTLMLSKHNVYSTSEKTRQRRMTIHESSLTTPNTENSFTEKLTKSEKLSTSDADDVRSSPKTKKKKLSTSDTDDVRSSPKKKKKKVSTSDTDDVRSSPKKQKNVTANSDSDAVEKASTSKGFQSEASNQRTEKRKHENGISSPSKKQKTAKEPVFPSQTTAHYYMTHAYDGKPKKIAKSYSKLDRQVKGKYRAEMRKARETFLKELAVFLQTMTPAEAKAYTEKIRATKADQLKEISWHNDDGTDTESKKGGSSSEDSDSDSDSS